jgi:hypothetical protein
MNADQILDLEKAPKKLAARQYTRLSGHCRNVSAKFLKGAAKQADPRRRKSRVVVRPYGPAKETVHRRISRPRDAGRDASPRRNRTETPRAPVWPDNVCAFAAVPVHLDKFVTRIGERLPHLDASVASADDQNSRFAYTRQLRKQKRDVLAAVQFVDKLRGDLPYCPDERACSRSP